MSVWVPTAFGALDLREHELAEQGYDLIVTPASPNDPLLLFGDGAELWLKLLEQPVDEADVNEPTLQMLHDFSSAGIASEAWAHPARVHSVQPPWMESTIHELVYALLANVAKSIDIDIVFIKGPSLQAQGLRRRAHSGDVDCWVTPGEELRLAEAMAAWGWTPMTSAFTGTSVAHSLTLSAGAWGCEIDVHTRFPGITTEPTKAFNIVRSGAEIREFAGVACLTPSTSTHAIVLALHELRPVAGVAPSALSAETAVEALRVAGPSTVEIVRELGAGHALDDSLASAFPDQSIRFEGAVPPPEWSWRLSESTGRGLLKALHSLPLRERPVVLRRLLFPDRAALAASGRLADTRGALWGFYLKRIARSVRSLFKAARS